MTNSLPLSLRHATSRKNNGRVRARIFASKRVKNAKNTRLNFGVQPWQLGTPRRTCRERRERNSDCYTQWQSRLRETKRCLRTTVLCTNTACWFCLLCPLRTISANAARLPLSLLAVSIRYSSTHEGSENPTTQGCGVRVVHPGGLEPPTVRIGI